jgi:hypothetical protein
VLQIINDPYRILFMSVQELFPHFPDVDIQFNYEMNMHEKEFGVTVFPDNEHENPLIEINPFLEVNASVEVLAHELAHVVCGPEAGHGDIFEETMQKIHEKYMGVYTREMKRYQAGGEPSGLGL